MGRAVKYLAHCDLYVELEYTRDDRRDLPCGGWECIPQTPDGIGWLLWDTNPDRKSGWIRVWGKRGRGLYIHSDGGCA